MPVLVVDVDEAVETKILATLDPIAKMAEGDAVMYQQIVENLLKNNRIIYKNL